MRVWIFSVIVAVCELVLVSSVHWLYRPGGGPASELSLVAAAADQL